MFVVDYNCTLTRCEMAIEAGALRSRTISIPLDFSIAIYIHAVNRYTYVYALYINIIYAAV